jgi:hypothetical protein
MKTTYKISGADAIRLAERDGLTLRKHADPVDGARIITADEAREIAREDAGLVYVLVHVRDWTDSADGKNVADYFTPSGRYKGPDDDGIEPMFADAGGNEKDKYEN